MMPRELSHPQYCQLHAINRLWQRFGVAIGHGEYDRLCRDVSKQPAVAFGYNDAPVYEVKIRDLVVYAVWSNAANCIVTFLPTPNAKQERGA
jgi:hypothetical protein